MKFGQETGGVGKRVVQSAALPSKARGKIDHQSQKASSFAGNVGLTRKDGGTARSKSKDVTNPVPGRSDNDSMGPSAAKKQRAYPAMPVATGLTGTKRSSPYTSTKGFVEKRGREFTGYK